MDLRPALQFRNGLPVYVWPDGTVLARVAGGDGESDAPVDAIPAELRDQLSRLAELEDAEVGELEGALLDRLDEVTGAEVIDDDVIAAAAAVRDAINAVRADAERRYTEAAEADAEAERRRAELQAIRDEVAPEEEGDEETEGDGEGEEGAEGEQQAEGTENTEGESTEGEGEGEQAEAVAAAAPTPPARQSHRPALSAVTARARRRQGRRQSAGPERPRVTLTAATDLRQFAAGQRLDPEQLAEAFVDRAMALRNVAPGANGMQYPVARAVVEYPTERQLSSMDVAQNEERLDATMGRGGRAALAASGGVCAPFMPDYTQVGISDDARPARGALPNYQADRGGVIHMQPPRFHRGLTSAELSEDSNAHDFSRGVGQWTQTNDVALNDPSTKPIVRVDCEEQITDRTYFVTQRLEVGNFFNMTFRERVAAIIDVLNAEHAALGERLLLDTISAGSKHISGAQLGGAASDILSHIDTMVARYENVWRMPEGHAPFELWLPDWVHDLIRADRVRTLTAGSTDERFAYTDAQIDAWFDARGCNVTWLMDGETGASQTFAAQADNAGIEPWPSHVIGYLFHNGGWAFMDGGTIDLGIIRDSVLADTNDLQFFKETAEGAFFRGWESIRFDLDVCPSGLSQGTASIDYCTLGS